MAPSLPNLPIHLLHRSHRPSLPATTQSILIGLVAVTSTLLLLTLLWLVLKISRHLSTRHHNNSAPANCNESQDTNLTRRPSDLWSRKNSNVLFASYITDEDLRAQFEKPGHGRRLFSIGSVSTLGPLDDQKEEGKEVRLKELVPTRVPAVLERTRTSSCPVVVSDYPPKLQEIVVTPSSLFRPGSFAL